jgi:4-amino-4-deoxy-L-arabinose transferase-like glycosyltransferase
MKLALSKDRFLSLPFVLVLAFTIRASVFVGAWWCAQDFSGFYAKDTSSYLQPASELLATGNFSTEGVPEIMRTPGYPLLLVLGMKLGHVEPVTIFLQIILSCLTCYFVYAITQQVFGDTRAAIWAAFLLSLEPLSILYSCLLLSDTLFVFLLVAALNWMIRARQQGHFVNWLLSAIALAGAIYTRPLGYFLPLALTLTLFIWAIVKRKRKLLFNTAVFCLLTMSLVGLWQVRNRLTTGYAGFSTTPEIVLYFYHTGAVRAQQQGIPFYQVVEQLGYYDSDIYFRNHPEQQTWTPSQRYAYLRNEGFKALRQTPIVYVQIYVRGMLVMLLDPGVVEYLKLFQQYQKSDRLLNLMAQQGVVAVMQRVITENPSLAFWGSLLGLILLSFYFLSFIGLKDLSVLAHLSLVILLCTSFYLIAISGGIIAVSRFRMPLMPIISVFAGHGLVVLLAGRKAKN